MPFPGITYRITSNNLQALCLHFANAHGFTGKSLLSSAFHNPSLFCILNHADTVIPVSECICEMLD